MIAEVLLLQVPLVDHAEQRGHQEYHSQAHEDGVVGPQGRVLCGLELPCLDVDLCSSPTGVVGGEVVGVGGGPDELDGPADGDRIVHVVTGVQQAGELDGGNTTHLPDAVLEDVVGASLVHVIRVGTGLADRDGIVELELAPLAVADDHVGVQHPPRRLPADGDHARGLGRQPHLDDVALDVPVHLEVSVPQLHAQGVLVLLNDTVDAVLGGSWRWNEE